MRNRSLHACSDLLRVRNDLLRACNDLLSACNGLLRTCNDLLRACNDLVRGCNDLLRACSDLLRACNDLCAHPLVYLQTARKINWREFPGPSDSAAVETWNLTTFLIKILNMVAGMAQFPPVKFPRQLYFPPVNFPSGL